MQERLRSPLDWDKLRIFHPVAQAGSFTRGGDSLNLSQSAVSRQISTLEENLHCPLFHRHARGLLLTEQGEVLYRTVHEVFSKLAMAEAQLLENRDLPFGPLKVTTTMAFGSVWLTPRIKKFLDEYPDIELSILLDDSELDLAMREADVAIRFKPPSKQDLIQRVLRSNKMMVFASPEYLAKHGVPQRPKDLDDHHIIGYAEEAQQPVAGLNWLLTEGRPADNPRKPILRVNNIHGIYRAARSGLGIAALPDYFVHESQTLVPILHNLKGPAFDAYFLYPEAIRNSKRVAVFRDFILRELAKMDG